MDKDDVLKLTGPSESRQHTNFKWFKKKLTENAKKYVQNMHSFQKFAREIGGTKWSSPSWYLFFRPFFVFPTRFPRNKII